MRRKFAFLFLGMIVLIVGCSIGINTGDLTVIPLEEAVSIRSSRLPIYDDFWEAMRQFDFDYINRNEVTEEQRNFAVALEYIMNGEYRDAETLFSTLFRSSSDSLIRKQAADILQSLLNLHSEWEQLVELDASLPNGLDDDNTVIMARAFSQLPPERYHYQDEPVVLPTTLSISGVPIVGVSVNGVEKNFWIDTGAEMTVVSSALAKECGIVPLGSETARIGTATDIKINMQPGVIEELRIGALRIENHPVIMLDKKDLEVKLFGIIKLVKIDGILGWNAIQNMDLTLDYRQLTITIRKPERRYTPERNFHFLDEPFVTLSDTLGTPFHFFLDVGAGNTHLYEFGLSKVDTSRFSTARAIVGGAGGMQPVRKRVLSSLSLIIGKNRIQFNQIDAHGEGGESFFRFDGILGSDIAQDRILILDFLNGRCDLKSSEEAL